MALNLAPEVENQVREQATREGVSENEYVARLLLRETPRIAPRLRLLSRDDARRLNAPSRQRLAQQIADAQTATPEEITQADAEVRALHQALNANRRATGERLLFPGE